MSTLTDSVKWNLATQTKFAFAILSILFGKMCSLICAPNMKDNEIYCHNRRQVTTLMFLVFVMIAPSSFEYLPSFL